MSMHGDLSFHVLRYALERVHEGDLSAALDLGFTIEEIRSMEGLTLKALAHLSRLSARFLRIEVDHQTYQAMLNRVSEAIESESLQDALLRAGAPRVLMSELFGWSALQCAQRRRVLAIVGTPGRPPLASEEEEARVWRLWSQHRSMPLAERYLKTAAAAEVTVATVYSLVRSWDNQGLGKNGGAQSQSPVAATSVRSGW